MSNEQKRASDEPKRGRRSKTGQNRPKRTRRLEVVNAEVEAKHIEGESTTEIALAEKQSGKHQKNTKAQE